MPPRTGWEDGGLAIAWGGKGLTTAEEGRMGEWATRGGGVGEGVARGGAG